ATKASSVGTRTHVEGRTGRMMRKLHLLRSFQIYERHRVVQQLREAFPEAAPYRYVILDHDSKFDADVVKFLTASGLQPKRTSVQAPWQNGLAECWVGSCPREIL